MREQYRALAVVLIIILPLLVFWRGEFRRLMPDGALERFSRLWIGLTLLEFLVPDFWFFSALAALWILVGTRGPSLSIALFPGLLLCVPAFSKDIPGFGFVNTLFSLD